MSARIGFVFFLSAALFGVPNPLLALPGAEEALRDAPQLEKLIATLRTAYATKGSVWKATYTYPSDCSHALAGKTLIVEGSLKRIVKKSNGNFAVEVFDENPEVIVTVPLQTIAEARYRTARVQFSQPADLMDHLEQISQNPNVAGVHFFIGEHTGPGAWLLNRGILEFRRVLRIDRVKETVEVELVQPHCADSLTRSRL